MLQPQPARIMIHLGGSILWWWSPWSPLTHPIWASKDEQKQNLKWSFCSVGGLFRCELSNWAAWLRVDVVVGLEKSFVFFPPVMLQSRRTPNLSSVFDPLSSAVGGSGECTPRNHWGIEPPTPTLNTEAKQVWPGQGWNPQPASIRVDTAAVHHWATFALK